LDYLLKITRGANPSGQLKLSLKDTIDANGNFLVTDANGKGNGLFIVDFKKVSYSIPKLKLKTEHKNKKTLLCYVKSILTHHQSINVPNAGAQVFLMDYPQFHSLVLLSSNV
jgi:hypothetical protein